MRKSVSKSLTDSVAEIGGSATPGDTVTLTVNNPVLSGGTESVTYTVQSGDDNIVIAEGVAALVNGNTNLSNIGITAQSDVPAVLDWSQSFKATQQTPGWNATSVSAIDGGNNSASASYSVFGVAPTPVNPTYDLNGNMTSDGTNAYLWDAENRLVEIDYPGSGNNSQFTYDGLGRCTQIVENSGGSPTSTRQFVWCGDYRCESRDATGAIAARYFALGENIGGTSYYFAKDHLGSIREMTDSSGLVSQYAYDAFGRKLKLFETTPSDFKYAGMYAHEESGLDITLFRPYSDSQGRWLSRDPILQSYNLYDYVGNSPVVFVDPLGLKEQCTLSEKAEAIARTSLMDAATARWWSVIAWDDAAKSGLPGQVHGMQDAYRHCIWSCFLAQKLGERDAETITTAHEMYNAIELHQPMEDQLMDMANNEVGRRLAKDYHPCPRKPCEKACMKALEAGELFGPGGVPFKLR